MLCSKMAKWNYVFLIKLSLISMILHFGCSTYNIQSEVCLEKAIEIAFWENLCWFTLEEAQDWLEKASESSCVKKCNVTMEGLDESNNYQLKYLALRIDSLMAKSTTNTRCISRSRIKKTLKVFCKTGLVDVDISDGLCTSPEECKDETKTCSSTGKVGFCTCKPGFIGFEDKCFKGNLRLKESCQQSEQCSAVFGSVCENNTCACKDGSDSINESECSLPPLVGSTQASVQDQKEDSVVGAMVGAVIGGLILGIALTVVGFIIYNNIRNRNPKAGQKQDQNVALFNNSSYETENEARQIHSTVQRTNERKIVNVPPFAHSMEISVTENTYTHHGNKSSMANSHDINNDVYNHLHAKEEDSDNDENYDHAHGNINRTMEESDYSNLNTGRRYMAPGVSATENNDYDERELPGDYC